MPQFWELTEAVVDPSSLGTSNMHCHYKTTHFGTIPDFANAFSGLSARFDITVFSMRRGKTFKGDIFLLWDVPDFTIRRCWWAPCTRRAFQSIEIEEK